MRLTPASPLTAHVPWPRCPPSCPAACSAPWAFATCLCRRRTRWCRAWSPARTSLQAGALVGCASSASACRWVASCAKLARWLSWGCRRVAGRRQAGPCPAPAWAARCCAHIASCWTVAFPASQTFASPPCLLFADNAKLALGRKANMGLADSQDAQVEGEGWRQAGRAWEHREGRRRDAHTGQFWVCCGQALHARLPAPCLPII